MIGYLSGRILSVSSESLILVVGGDGAEDRSSRHSGVGYEVQSHLRLLAEVVPGDFTQLWIHTHVREDAIQLFGFESAEEKSFFLNLLKVNGVGPKLALGILSGGSPEQIVALIEAEDVKGLSRIPKLGKKTAEQLILTLKGKLVFGEKTVAPAGVGGRKDIQSALLNLGFKLTEVERVMAKLPPSIDFEEGIKICLSGLATV